MINFEINGAIQSLDIDPETPLLWAIRDNVGLTGTKYGCGVALCGACTVLVDGQPTRSCSFQVSDAAGKVIRTIEGLSGPVSDAVGAAWRALDVVQCGYCQSGQIVSAVALLTKTREPTDDDIDSALDGNLCRCATYVRIRAAVHAAAKLLEI